MILETLLLVGGGAVIYKLLGGSNIPEKPGVYMFIDRDGDVVYVGRTENLKRRYGQHTKGPISVSSFRKTLYQYHGWTEEEITQYIKSLKFKYEVIHDDDERMRREKELIQRHYPLYNKHYNILDDDFFDD